MTREIVSSPGFPPPRPDQKYYELDTITFCTEWEEDYDISVMIVNGLTVDSTKKDMVKLGNLFGILNIRGLIKDLSL